VVEHRERHGAYASRDALLRLPGFGPRTFELAAGFLRVRGGENPLDSTGVHPERYPAVEGMARELGVRIGDLVGNPSLVSRLDFARFADAAKGLGTFTLGDIRAELERPGRDPRPDFRTPQWRADVTTVKDLAAGMVLEGRVSNVANFGAFVDIGVHRDGLVHVSELSHRWIGDPRQAVQVGQIVKVKVLEVDAVRERVSLSLKALLAPEPVPAAGGKPPRPAPARRSDGGAAKRGNPAASAAASSLSGSDRGAGTAANVRGAGSGGAAAAPVRPPHSADPKPEPGTVTPAARSTPARGTVTPGAQAAKAAPSLEDLMRKFNRR
jgi:protein Tex